MSFSFLLSHSPSLFPHCVNLLWTFENNDFIHNIACLIAYFATTLFLTPKQINGQHIVFVKCMKGQLLLYSGLVRVCRISAGKSTDVTVCFVMSLVQVRDGYERGVCGGRQLCGVPAVLLLRQSGSVFQLLTGLWETSSKQTQRLELQVSDNSALL